MTGSTFPFLNMVAGVSLNPIIVYCGSQEEMDLWFGLLQENIEANGGTAIAPRNYARVKVRGHLRSHALNVEPTLTLLQTYLHPRSHKICSIGGLWKGTPSSGLCFHGGWRKPTLWSVSGTVFINYKTGMCQIYLCHNLPDTTGSTRSRMRATVFSRSFGGVGGREGAKKWAGPKRS